MKKCIYCGKTDSEITFDKGEHVIPRMLGTFNDNMILHDCVCDHCNSVVFNLLETKFKEDTVEGVKYQMLNFEDRPEIRVRNKDLKINFETNLGSTFFNEIFPSLILQNGKLVVIFKPQIKINGYCQSGFRVLFLDKIIGMKTNCGAFKNIKEQLKKANKKEINVFVNAQSNNDNAEYQKAMKILSELEISYKEHEKQYISTAPDINNIIHVNTHSMIGEDFCRVIAKIAFNYFAFCAISCGMSDILYENNFNDVKEYILSDTPSLREKIIFIEKEPILAEEAILQMRIPWHVLAFEEENGNIIVRISLLGQRTYKIILGKIPDLINKPNFGSGNIFDVVSHNIDYITKNRNKIGSNQRPSSLGLFNKI